MRIILLILTCLVMQASSARSKGKPSIRRSKDFSQKSIPNGNTYLRDLLENFEVTGTSESLDDMLKKVTEYFQSQNAGIPEIRRREPLNDPLMTLLNEINSGDISFRKLSCEDPVFDNGKELEYISSRIIVDLRAKNLRFHANVPQLNIGSRLVFRLKVDKGLNIHFHSNRKIGELDEIPFHLSIRPDENAIVIGALVRQVWVAETRVVIPFSCDNHVTLTVEIDEFGYLIRHEDMLVQRFYIQGKLSLIQKISAFGHGEVDYVYFTEPKDDVKEPEQAKVHEGEITAGTADVNVPNEETMKTSDDNECKCVCSEKGNEEDVENELETLKEEGEIDPVDSPGYSDYKVSINQFPSGSEKKMESNAIGYTGSNEINTDLEYKENIGSIPGEPYQEVEDYVENDADTGNHAQEVDNVNEINKRAGDGNGFERYEDDKRFYDEEEDSVYNRNDYEEPTRGDGEMEEASPNEPNAEDTYSIDGKAYAPAREVAETEDKDEETELKSWSPDSEAEAPETGALILN